MDYQEQRQFKIFAGFVAFLIAVFLLSSVERFKCSGLGLATGMRSSVGLIALVVAVYRKILALRSITCHKVKRILPVTPFIKNVCSRCSF